MPQGDSNGGVPADDERREPLPAPEHIAVLAASCIDFVRHATGVEPDLQAETLPVVDHWVATARQSLPERPSLLPLLARTLGAYFGEVLRRRIPAFWRAGEEGDERSWAVCGSEVYFAINPVGVAYDALCAGNDHPGPSSELRCTAEEEGAVAVRLAALPEVPEDEFWLLSTRLETLEIAAEALREAKRARGYEDMTFGEEDYGAD